MDNICLTSLFSKEYEIQGIVMIETFINAHPYSQVQILALDSVTQNNLEDHFGKRVSVTGLTNNQFLSDLFQNFRLTRSQAEAIFTLKVYWLNYVSRIVSQGSKLIYADADLYFLKELSQIRESDWSLLISPHHFPRRRETLLSSGAFNAGLLAINIGVESKSILSWWQDRVTEYCGTSKSDGLYADQKYIESFKFHGERVKEFRDSGTNVGMWQVCETRRLTREGEVYKVDGIVINSFHFHGFRIYENVIGKGALRYGIPRGSIRVTFHLYRKYMGDIRRIYSRHKLDGLVVYTHRFKTYKEIVRAVKNPLFCLDFFILSHRRKFRN
jgi:hypothetical protein